MSHEISIRENGFAEFAAVGDRWHGLGQFMEPGASLDVWASQAGLDYKIQRSFVRYAVSRNAQQIDYRQMDDQVVLFRSDTGAPLGLVSDGYKVVQPLEVLEFFRDWADQGGLQLESAGVLFGGKRYFATAKLGDGVLVGEGDMVIPYVLLSSSCDGSSATEARWTTVRTVCNNTLSMARAGSKAAHKTSHRSVFKPGEAMAAIEAAHAEFGAFCTTARELQELKVSRRMAEEFTLKLLTEKSIADESRIKNSTPYTKILELFRSGAGQDLPGAQYTAWGYLNAITDYVDHASRAKSDDQRILNAQWGNGDTFKQAALNLMLA
jgi:phage/plasmid-like protein (TIGR03299 family)